MRTAAIAAVLHELPTKHASAWVWNRKLMHWSRWLQVLEGDLEGVVGMQNTIGYFEINGELQGRQDVFFTGIQMQAKESRFTGSWTTTLMEHNEGTMVHPLPCPTCPFPHPAHLRAFAHHCLRHNLGRTRRHEAVCGFARRNVHLHLCCRVEQLLSAASTPAMPPPARNACPVGFVLGAIGGGACSIFQ